MTNKIMVQDDSVCVYVYDDGSIELEMDNGESYDLIPLSFASLSAIYTFVVNDIMDTLNRKLNRVDRS